MAEVALALGAEIDIASSGELDAMGAGIMGALRGKDPLSYTPLGVSKTWITKVAAVAGVNPTLIDFGSPSQGRVWTPTIVSVVGNDGHTVVAGASVELYVGQLPLPGQQPNLENLVLVGSAQVPTTSTFGEKALLVLDQEHLYAAVYGAAALAQLVGIAKGWDRPQEWMIELAVPWYSKTPGRDRGSLAPEN